MRRGERPPRMHRPGTMPLLPWLLLSLVLALAVTYTLAEEEMASPDAIDALSYVAPHTEAPPTEMLFQFIPEAAELSATFNSSAYVPAFMHDTTWQELWSALEDAMIGSYEFLRLWIVFAVLVSGPLLQLLQILVEALVPHFLVGLQLAGEAVMELEPKHQAILLAVTLAIIICYRQGYVQKARRRIQVFRRHMHSRYRAFVMSLNEKSRIVALAVPHIVFLGIVYALVFWSPSVVLELWSHEALTALLAVGIPLLRSIGAIYRKRMRLVRERNEREQREKDRLHQQASPANSGSSAAVVGAPAGTVLAAAARLRRGSPSASYNEWRSYEACLKYWVLWSIAVTVTSMVSLFVPTFIASYFAVPTAWFNILLAWLHSPVARGDIALYTLLSPVINPYAHRLAAVGSSIRRRSSAYMYSESETPENENNEYEPSTIIMRTLVAVGVMKPHYMHLIKDLWSQGPALGGLIFIFTPGFVTARGALLVGFGFPAYITMGALADKRTRDYEWWLLYFCVAVIVDNVLAALYDSLWWLPLFFHGKLLIMMWLQFPYFRGARTIFDGLFTSIFVAARETKPKEE